MTTTMHRKYINIKITLYDIVCLFILQLMSAAEAT
jgi:hypothetical protein